MAGPGKTVHKRGEGLGTGPVGDTGGYKDRAPQNGGEARGSGSRGGGMKLIVLLLALLLGGGGGLTALLGGQPSGTQTQLPPQDSSNSSQIRAAGPSTGPSC